MSILHGKRDSFPSPGGSAMITRWILALATLWCILLFTATPRAQLGKLALFSDSTFTDSTLVDATPGQFTVYIVHVDAIGIAGSKFSVAMSAGFTATYLGDQSHAGAFIGNTVDGLSIG